MSLQEHFENYSVVTLPHNDPQQTNSYTRFMEQYLQMFMLILCRLSRLFFSGEVCYSFRWNDTQRNDDWFFDIKYKDIEKLFIKDDANPTDFYVNWGRNIYFPSWFFRYKKICSLRERVIDLWIFRLCHFLCFDEEKKKCLSTTP